MALYRQDLLHPRTSNSLVVCRPMNLTSHPFIYRCSDSCWPQLSTLRHHRRHHLSKEAALLCEMSGSASSVGQSLPRSQPLHPCPTFSVQPTVNRRRSACRSQTPSRATSETCLGRHAGIVRAYSQSVRHERGVTLKSMVTVSSETCLEAPRLRLVLVYRGGQAPWEDRF